MGNCHLRDCLWKLEISILEFWEITTWEIVFEIGNLYIVNLGNYNLRDCPWKLEINILQFGKLLLEKLFWNWKFGKLPLERLSLETGNYNLRDCLWKQEISVLKIWKITSWEIVFGNFNWYIGNLEIVWQSELFRQKVVLLPGTTQLQEKDILLRLGASKEYISD